MAQEENRIKCTFRETSYILMSQQSFTKLPVSKIIYLMPAEFDFIYKSK